MNFEKLVAYHDAEFVRVDSASKQRELSLSFVLSNGEVKNLILMECEFFRVLDYTSQNIVSRVLILHGASSDRSFLTDRLIWAASLSDAPSFLSAERCSNLLMEIEASKLVLFLLEPSAGAEVVALCKSVAEA
jgi:hypothetical protein